MPDSLMQLVLRKLYDSHRMGMKNVKWLLRLRLVCKAWKDACTRYTGMAIIYTRNNTNLDQLCKLLPRLSGVTLDYFDTVIDLRPLSALTDLTCLCLHEAADTDEFEDEEPGGPPLDLTPLPASVKALELDSCRVDASCYQHLKFGGLTSLLYFWTSDDCTEAVNFLQHLPVLKVSEACSQPSFAP